MSVQININDILIEKSHFSLSGIIYETDNSGNSLEDSFKQVGVLYPVIVYRDGNNKFHLIDGRKRIHYAKQTAEEAIPAIVLTDTAEITDIITLMLCNRIKDIEQGVMNKILFVCFAMYLKAPEPWILNSLCTSFGFKPYSEFLKDCERINNLPAEMKLFCHEKRFSMKQIINLTHYPGDILLQLMEWKAVLQLTTSILDEIASNLKDYLKSQDMTIKEFISEPEVREIIQSPLSSRDKTGRLRQLIHMKRFPVLSGTNARIGEKVSQLNLPKGISINWDRTLENKNVDITVHVEEPEKMIKLMDTLNSAQMKQLVKDILDEL
ncbi:MAG: ParB/RepB/Spo0J family partition protein [Nitrospirae bacterium]|nr:ParB/RepB/Spo0J family partition protein [Nitrospirota bacterium]